MNPFALLAQRSRRERLLALLLSVSLGLGAVWMGVIQPLRQGISRSEARIEQAHKDLLDMRATLARLQALEGRGVSGNLDTKTESFFAIDREAKRLNLKLERIEPAGEGARTQFSAAPFNEVVKLLDVLSRQYGLNVTNVVLTRSEAGRVDGRITWQRGRK